MEITAAQNSFIAQFKFSAVNSKSGSAQSPATTNSFANGKLLPFVHFAIPSCCAIVECIAFVRFAVCKFWLRYCSATQFRSRAASRAFNKGLKYAPAASGLRGTRLPARPLAKR